MQGWFVGFASAAGCRRRAREAQPRRLAPDKVDLVVLVFLSRGHGAEAAEVARPIFAEYARQRRDSAIEARGNRGRQLATRAAADSPRPRVASSASPARNSLSASIVRVHLVRENITRTMSIEDYVRGVVAAEGSTETEVEALKALAIASRTYALRNIHRHERDGYDFCTTTHCQRYRSRQIQAY